MMRPGAALRLALRDLYGNSWRLLPLNALLGAVLVVIGWVVEALVFKWYITSLANFRTAVGSLTVALIGVTFLYVSSIILLVGIELDELLREDGKDAERTIAHAVRDLF